MHYIVAWLYIYIYTTVVTGIHNMETKNEKKNILDKIVVWFNSKSINRITHGKNTVFAKLEATFDINSVMSIFLAQIQ